MGKKHFKTVFNCVLVLHNLAVDFQVTTYHSSNVVLITVTIFSFSKNDYCLIMHIPCFNVKKSVIFMWIIFMCLVCFWEQTFSLNFLLISSFKAYEAQVAHTAWLPWGNTSKHCYRIFVGLSQCHHNRASLRLPNAIRGQTPSRRQNWLHPLVQVLTNQMQTALYHTQVIWYSQLAAWAPGDSSY
jgi:hypothetical protein